MIEKRVSDGSVLRLIRKWIQVGVIDEGRLLVSNESEVPGSRGCMRGASCCGSVFIMKTAPGSFVDSSFPLSAIEWPAESTFPILLNSGFFINS
jgi:hypothetical protein